MLNEEKLSKLLRIISIFAIACCCVLLIPQVRSFIVEIAEKAIGRNLRDHNKWMNILLMASLFAIFCFGIILVSLYKDLNKVVNYRYFPEITLFLLFLGISVLILMKTYFGGEYIFDDTMYYLRAAQSILNGHGFSVYAEAGWDNIYFSQWPIGYPFLIACVSFITRTEVYLASKILTILTLAGIFGLLYLKFKKRAWIYALIMVCYPSFLKDFYNSLSEQLFLFGSLLLAFEIIDVISKVNPKIYHYFNILIACLLMFFVRYVGIQAIGILGLIIIHFIVIQIIMKKSMLKKIIPLTAVLFIVFVVCIGYFYLNYINTGNIAGTPNRGEVHSLAYIFNSAIDLCIGQMLEVSYIFQIYLVEKVHSILLALVILFGIFYLYKKESRIKHSLDSFVFIAMSLFFVFVFFLFRITTEVDAHYERHLLVSTILFAFGCITLFFEYKNGIFVKIRQIVKKKKILSVCVLFIWFGITPLRAYTVSLLSFLNGTNVSYQQTRNKILNDLSSVPPKAIVIYAAYKEAFVFFLRSDIIPVYLYSILREEEYPWLLPNIQIFDIYDNVYLYLDTEFIVDDDLVQKMQENSLLKDYVYSRNDRLIKLK